MYNHLNLKWFRHKEIVKKSDDDITASHDESGEVKFQKNLEHVPNNLNRYATEYFAGIMPPLQWVMELPLCLTLYSNICFICWKRKCVLSKLLCFMIKLWNLSILYMLNIMYTFKTYMYSQSSEGLLWNMDEVNAQVGPQTERRRNQR